MIQRAFFKQTSTATFLTLQRGSQGHCPWSFVSVAPHDNDPDGNSPNVVSVLPSERTRLVQGLRLAVDKVIHHDDIALAIIIRARGDVAGCDPNRCDERILKRDAEEGKTPIARRGRNEAAEQKFAVRVEVLQQRTRPTVSAVSALPAWPAAVRLVNICENRAEATDRCWYRPIAAWHEEQSLGDIAPYRSEQAKRAEGAEIGVVLRIVEEHCKARWRSLREAYPRCGELGAAGVQKRVERVYRWCSRGGSTNAIPVDLAVTASVERRLVIAVVRIAQSRTKRIHRALNRVSRWSCRLEHDRREEVIIGFALRLCRLANRDEHHGGQQTKREDALQKYISLHACMLNQAP